MKNIFSDGLQANLDKEEKSDKHAVDDKIPSDFMRVCVDYSKLNRFLAKKKYLSTKKVSAAYKVLPLDEHSKELTCFYTPYSIYKAETLPFGLATATALFVAEIQMLDHPKSKRVCGNKFAKSKRFCSIEFRGSGTVFSIKEDEKDNIGHLKHTTVENELIQKARADPHYKNMFKRVFYGAYRHLEKHQLSLTGEMNVMTLNGKLKVSVGSGKRIVAKVHRDYHEGTRNLTNQINTNFIIHRLTKMMKKVIAQCKFCQMFRKNEPSYSFVKIIKQKLDFLKVLKEIVALVGDFELLVSDNKPVFQSEEVAEWLEERGTLDFFVPTYSPRSNGLAEEMTNFLKNKMKKAQKKMNLNAEKSLT
uniref:RNA-directed DNA polymerase n=1 Tax=Strongyloides venezuelensis TaxID=75913 RepID=A0A0K0G3H9_STRVS